MTVMIALKLILSLTLCFVSPSGGIDVYTCCPNGQGLTSETVCEEVNRQWNPIIFAPTDGKLLPPGQIPDNFVFQQRSPECEKPLYFADAAHAVLIVNNGSLYVSDMLLSAGKFCMSPSGLLICLPEGHPFKKNPEKRVRKCCLMGAVYSEVRATCVTPNETSTPNFLSEDTLINSGFPECESKHFTVAGKLDENYSLNVDGTLRTINRTPVVNFCVEHILESPNEKASIFTCDNRPVREDIRYTIYPLGFFLSIFFLTITLISSCMLPSSYHALHWKCQTHYVACLLIGDFLLAVTQIAGGGLRDSVTCVGLATAMHFFFLAAFFWLNTMCFNIWWTFRDLRPTSLDKGQETYRLILYELYAWGGPFIIVSVGAVFDQILTDQYSTVLRPKFGNIRCWFEGDMEVFVYFFGPVGLLLLVNLILFVATTRELTCGLWKREVVKSTTERTALSHICLKLVIVMGITWIVDVLSWIIGGPDYVWYLTDLVNCLQGVFIFIVVGCQPQVWTAIKRMWCLNDSRSRNGGPSYSSNATPSIINDQSSTKPVETLC